MKTRIFCLSTLAICLCVLPTLAVAQNSDDGPRAERGERSERGERGERGDREGRGDRGGQRGGRGGPGGFGGRGGQGGSSLALVQIPEVRDELDLTDEQLGALTRLRDSARPEEGFDRSKIRDMSEQERREWFLENQEKRKEQASQIEEQMEDVLLPSQLERLKQISIQTRGAGALMDKDVRDDLDLSDEQIEQMKETGRVVQEEMRTKMREMFKEGNFQGAREKMSELRKETEEKIMSILTSQQREKLDSLRGEPFEMPERDERGFGRGGGGSDRGGLSRGRGNRRGGPDGPGQSDSQERDSE